MGIIVANIKVSKNPVNTGEKFKIQVAVRETISESINYRLPFKFGSPKGNLK